MAFHTCHLFKFPALKTSATSDEVEQQEWIQSLMSAIHRFLSVNASGRSSREHCKPMTPSLRQLLDSGQSLTLLQPRNASTGIDASRYIASSSAPLRALALSTKIPVTLASMQSPIAQHLAYHATHSQIPERMRNTHARTRARTHTPTHPHTHPHTHPQRYTETHTHTDTQTHRHTDTQTHRHTDTQTHKHTTHTHTHTHTIHAPCTSKLPQASSEKPVFVGACFFAFFPSWRRDPNLENYPNDDRGNQAWHMPGAGGQCSSSRRW